MCLLRGIEFDPGLLLKCPVETSSQKQLIAQDRACNNGNGSLEQARKILKVNRVMYCAAMKMYYWDLLPWETDIPRCCPLDPLHSQQGHAYPNCSQIAQQGHQSRIIQWDSGPLPRITLSQELHIGLSFSWNLTVVWGFAYPVFLLSLFPSLGLSDFYCSLKALLNLFCSLLQEIPCTSNPILASAPSDPN